MEHVCNMLTALDHITSLIQMCMRHKKTARKHAWFKQILAACYVHVSRNIIKYLFMMYLK